MREYGQIQCAFWIDPELQSLSDEAVLLAVYLMTGPHSNGLGCYRLPDGYIQADRGWTPETIKKAFGELSDKGFAYRCERTGFVIIPNFLRWNPITNANVATAREREFYLVPKTFEHYSLLVQSLIEHGKHWSKGFLNHLETLCEGFGKQEQEQEQEHDQINTPDGVFVAGAADDGQAQCAGGGVNPKKSNPPPACPHQDIIDLYHEILPELPRVKVWDKQRQGFLRARWREDAKRQNLDWWRRFFTAVRTSPWLMGQVPGREGRVFVCTLEWLIRPTNFRKVIEGYYADRRAA